MKLMHVALLLRTLTSVILPASFSSAQVAPTINLVSIADVGDVVTDIVGTNRTADDDLLFVATRGGQVKVVDTSTSSVTRTFIDLSSKVRASTGGGEQGLLGLAFHPDYENNKHFLVHYSCNNADVECSCANAPDPAVCTSNGQSVTLGGRGGGIISRCTSDPTTDFQTAEPSSCVVLAYIWQPNGNHNGGALKFGQDGYLYIGLGDGGSGNDQAYSSPTNGYGQEQDTLLGKILRVDVPVGLINTADPLPRWTIPTDNPFFGSTTTAFREEVWATGMRNPWRISFDRGTNDLWIADVGQGSREEINFQPAAVAGGDNYGWVCCEGFEYTTQSKCTANSNSFTQCGTTGAGTDYGGTMYKPPIHDYDSNNGCCSVTGGYVYRGGSYPSLQGIYFYADYCCSAIQALKANGFGGWDTSGLIATNPTTQGGTTTFGEDNSGELYVGDVQGNIYQIVDDTLTPTPTLRPSTSTSPSSSIIPTIDVTAVCPDTYQATLAIDAELEMKYSVALAPGSGYRGLLCVQLSLQRLAWAAVGFLENSQTVTMVGSEAVIGRPDLTGSDAVRKYDLQGQNVNGIVPLAKQTLRNTSLVQSNGVTTVTFEKLLVEDSEITIDGQGISGFIWAYGSAGDAFTQHDQRGSFAIDFTPCTNDANCTGTTASSCTKRGCPAGLCTDVPFCPDGEDCEPPICSTCGVCNTEADCSLTPGCSWSGGGPACVQQGTCTSCSQQDCLDVGCNWNNRKQTCKGGPTVTSGQCEGTASPVVTCTAACVINEMDEVSCSDGIDNDCDGLADCDDLDCASSSSCVESDCSNGVDDDGDGDIDCADSDCASSSSCVESDCSNGEDDDGDGDIDCADSDCVADANCQPSCLVRGDRCGSSISGQCCTNLSCKGKTCK